MKLATKLGIVAASSVLSFAGIVTTSTTSANAAQILLQDNFNAENGGTVVLNYNGFANWNVVSGTVDLIKNGRGNVSIPDPGRELFLDMDGSTKKAGKIESKNTFAFNPGDLINLTFQLAGNRRYYAPSAFDSVVVSLGDFFTKTYTLPGDQVFTTFTETFSVGAATNAKLAFQGVGNDNIGMLLDNVSLSKSVPEPLTLGGSALALGLGWWAKRKRTAATTKV
jgi:hypothetical protein